MVFSTLLFLFRFLLAKRLCKVFLSYILHLHTPAFTTISIACSFHNKVNKTSYFVYLIWLKFINKIPFYCMQAIYILYKN